MTQLSTFTKGISKFYQDVTCCLTSQNKIMHKICYLPKFEHFLQECIVNKLESEYFKWTPAINREYPSET